MNRVVEVLKALEKSELQKSYRLMEEIQLNGDPEEKFDLADHLFQLGFLEQAKELYLDLLDEFPEEGELKVRMAEVFIEMDDIENALLILENIREEDPVFGECLLLQADLYQLQGLWEVSEQKLLKAEKAFPNEVVIQFALGELYASLGRFAQAIRYYETVLYQQEEIAGVNLNERLAETYSAAGEFEKALTYYEKINNLRLDINTLFGYGFTAYNAGYWRTAIEKFQEVITLDPEYQSVYLLLAKSFEHENDLENSIKTVKEGLKVNDFQKELYMYGGKISLKLQEKERAEQFLREALVVDPFYVDAMITLNKILLNDEKYDEVIEITEPAIKEGEEDPELLWDLAVSCQQVERYSDALNYYQHAYNFLKENEQFLQSYGEFLLEEGKRGEAIEIFKQLVKMDPGNVDYTNTLEHLTTDDDR